MEVDSTNDTVESPVLPVATIAEAQAALDSVVDSVVDSALDSVADLPLNTPNPELPVEAMEIEATTNATEEDDAFFDALNLQPNEASNSNHDGNENTNTDNNNETLEVLENTNSNNTAKNKPNNTNDDDDVILLDDTSEDGEGASKNPKEPKNTGESSKAAPKQSPAVKATTPITRTIVVKFIPVTPSTNKKPVAKTPAKKTPNSVAATARAAATAAAATAAGELAAARHTPGANRMLVSDLIAVSMKLCQDNYRLKRFCGNFKQYVTAYAENLTAAESQSAKDVTDISEKFSAAFVDVQGELFNDTASFKRLLDRSNFSDSQMKERDLNSGEGSSSSSSEVLNKSNATMPTGRCPLAMAHYLFTQSQRNLARLEHDIPYREILLDSILGPNPASAYPSYQAMVGRSLRQTPSRVKTGGKKGSGEQTPKQPSFLCSGCGADFPFLDSLLLHQAAEHDAPFRCFGCSGKFKQRSFFVSHLSSRKCNIGGERPPRPPKPGPRFYQKAKCKKISSFGGSKKQPEEQSGTPPTSSVNAQGHRIPVIAPTTEANIFICPYCRNTFKRALNLRAHIRGVHAGDPGFRGCTISEMNGELTTEISEVIEPGEDLEEGQVVPGAGAEGYNPREYICRPCNRHFGRSIYLVDHIKTVHTENSCTSCAKAFKVRSTLNRHIKESNCARTEAKEAIARSYACAFCQFPFKRLTHLNQHILRKHSNDPGIELVVESYNGGNTKPADLFPEALEQLDWPVECPACPGLSPFSRMTPFLAHLQSEHRSAEVGGAGLACLHCSKHFKTRPAMATHVRESVCFRTEKVPGHKRPYRCKICSKGFKMALHLSVHMRSVHGFTKDGESKKKKTQKMVNAPWHYDRTGGASTGGKEGGGGDKKGGEVNPDDEELEEDEEQEEIVLDEDGVEVILQEGEKKNGNKRLKRRGSIAKCKWLGCDYVGDDVIAVNEHRKVVHLGWDATSNTFNCVYCSKGERTFQDTESCLAHLNEQHKARYKCNYNNGTCDYQTSSLRELRDHKATRHIKLRCFTCDWPNCSKTFVNPSLVGHHIRTAHKNERKHPCVWPGCGQSFKKPIVLKQHMALHTGVCDWRCPVLGCGQSFRNPGSLHLHRKKHPEDAELESAVSSISGAGGAGAGAAGGGSASSTSSSLSSFASASASMMSIRNSNNQNNTQQQQQPLQQHQQQNYQQQTQQLHGYQSTATTSGYGQSGGSYGQPSVTVVYNNSTNNNHQQQQQQNQQQYHLQANNNQQLQAQQQQQQQMMNSMLANSQQVHSLNSALLQNTSFQYLQQHTQQQLQQQQQPSSQSLHGLPNHSTQAAFSYPPSYTRGKFISGTGSGSGNSGTNAPPHLHHCTLNGCTAAFADAASLRAHSEAVHLFSMITSGGSASYGS